MVLLEGGGREADMIAVKSIFFVVVVEYEEG
jgi:hypothetical protein